MSTERLKLENDLCRCCLTEGTFQSLSEPQIVSGEQIVYSKMLLHSLSIDILPVAGPHSESTYKICESCSLRLRDATNFKQQVMLCEERFKNMYDDILKDLEVKQESSGIIDLTECIKEEMSPLEDDMDPDFDNTDFGFTDEGTGAAIDDDDKSMLQIMLENKQKKSKCKAKTKKAVKKPKKPAKKKKAEEAESEGAEPKKAKTAQQHTIQENVDYKHEGNVYMCTRCDKTYGVRQSIRYHVKVKHKKIPKFRCKYCYKRFTTLTQLTIHKLEEHKIDDRSKCNACSAIYNTSWQYQKHMESFHMQGEKYTCDKCDYETFSSQGLKRHKVKHTTDKKFHCKFCKKSFLRENTLNFHERIHTGDRRKVCEECGKAFVQKASLNYHMTKYHPEVNF